MNSFWNNINERERILIKVTVCLLAVYLFYIAIYSPVHKAIIYNILQLQEKKETLVWMSDIQQQINHKPKASISTAKLMALIGKQINNSPIHAYAYQLQQTNLGEIQLSFEQIPYNTVLLWLWSLCTSNYSLQLKQLDIEKTNNPGFVKIMLVIKPL